MASKYPYVYVIRNDELGVQKTIRGMSEDDCRWQIQAQHDKWEQQLERTRERETKRLAREDARREADELKAQAENETRQAEHEISQWRSVLCATLSVDDRIDWERLIDRSRFEEFKFTRQKPELESVRNSVVGKELTIREVRFNLGISLPPSFWTRVIPPLRRRRNELEVQAEYLVAKRQKERERNSPELVAEYNWQVQEYNEALKAAHADYVNRKARFDAAAERHNKSIVEFKARFENGQPDAVERYVQMVLERSRYPCDFAVDADVQVEDSSQTVIVNFWLPKPADLPTIKEYRFNARRKTVDSVEMKKKEHDAFYDDVVHQIALRTIHEVFEAVYVASVQAVVFNGWVRGVDQKTGQDFTSCIISCEAARDAFSAFDLRRVSPRDCVRGLKGIVAGGLAELAPVRPILDINRDDERFVESREILDALDPQDNLATMEWQDFEHLVRELFGKVFAKDGAEVKVTQASRDGGVDAIAFDPDPIRGGKFVIQAKRYNNVVPVSAVRDLYGTMINEGATKGILVTTSSFGRDSREFSKDKPITLIDGANLVHMFHEYGRSVHIQVKAKAQSTA